MFALSDHSAAFVMYIYYLLIYLIYMYMQESDWKMKTVDTKMDMTKDVPFSRTYRNKNANKEGKVYLSYSVFPFLSAEFIGNR